MKVGDTVIVKLNGPTRNSMHDHNVKVVYENELGILYGTTTSFGIKMLVEFWQSSPTTNAGSWIGEVDELQLILNSIPKEAPQA